MGFQYGLNTGRYRRKITIWNLLTGIVLFGLTLDLAKSQLVNTPPVLYMSERNWLISETEKVGQVIARARADDAEGDELVFGLEPRFLTRTNDASGISTGKLPFRIDPVAGIVYLNESIAGRAGENILLYVTVSDGQFSAKNEVFVNILNKNDRRHQNSFNPPSISNIVQNILPSFESLPGVQSVRNKPYLNRHPSNNFPPGIIINQQNLGVPGNNPISNLNIHTQSPLWTADPNNANDEFDSNDEKDSLMPEEQSSTSRTKLTPILSSKNKYDTDRKPNTTTSIVTTLNTITSIPTQTTSSENNSNANDKNSKNMTTNASFSLKSPIFLLVISICGLSVATAVVIGVIYRKNLCAISKTLKKKSKEELTKKSNQSNLSCNLTDESRNSMVMQHWNGPTAHGNRYVPWERDTQLMQFNVQSSSAFMRNNIGQIQNYTPREGNDDIGAQNSQSKYDQWEFPRHRLKFFNILGEGAFGQVWRCEATDIDGNEGVTTVAVKTLKENAAEVEKKDLMSELEVMKSLEPHVNVVRFLGCCTEKDPVFVIIEYVNRGKLQTYLRNSRAERHYGNTHGKSNVLTSGDLTSFMYQVAKGMDFLTSRGIIHRDLAARNILITDEHTCKVADFGFARDVVTSKIYERKSEGKLPIRWMAIESLYDNIFSIKSDIWSFGILMWEIVTLGSTPYPGISAGDVMKKVRDGYRLEKPEHCRRELYNIMYYCWSKDPNERPTFSEIVEMLDKLLHTEMDYIELERFPDHNYYNILSLSGEKL